MSVVHFKFKNSLEYDSVTFDGLAISLSDLKKAVMFKKRMRPSDTDLQVINAQTFEGRLITLKGGIYAAALGTY